MKTLCFKTRNLCNIFALSGCIFHMGFYDRPEVLFVDFCRRCEYIALLSKPRPLRCSIKTVSIVRDVVFFVYISIIEKVSFLRQLWLLWIISCVLWGCKNITDFRHRSMSNLHGQSLLMTVYGKKCSWNFAKTVASARRSLCGSVTWKRCESGCARKWTPCSKLSA